MATRTPASTSCVVEAVDSLGLSRTSIEVPVTVTVVQPPRGLAAFFGRYRETIIIGAVGFAALVLLLILFTGRLRALFSRARRNRAHPGRSADPDHLGCSGDAHCGPRENHPAQRGGRLHHGPP